MREISGIFNWIIFPFEWTKWMCLFCKGISIGKFKFHHWIAKGLCISLYTVHKSKFYQTTLTIIAGTSTPIIKQLFLKPQGTFFQSKYLQDFFFFLNFLQNRRSPSLLFFIHFHGIWKHKRQSNLTLSSAICVKYP